MEARKVLDTEAARTLVSAIGQLSAPSEVEAFLTDLCTPREIEDLSQRLEVAQLLDAGKPYLSVQEQTGASSTTVSRRCSPQVSVSDRSRYDFPSSPDGGSALLRGLM